ncbi:MAG: hypothetical protein Q7T71_03590 [Herbiconiux sp.]|nr:hypothetical protein [Herbiconiux sp.]
MSSSTVASASGITTSWPSSFPAHKPGVGTFAVREVEASADAVFAWVRRIDQQPPFYKGMKFVRRLSGPWPQLDKGSVISFTLGATFIPMVKVIKCDPETRSFVWGGGLPGLTMAHAFTVEPISDTRSLLRSEELWVGPVAQLIAPGVRGPMQAVQTRWAEALAAAAKAHPAGPPAHA